MAEERYRETLIAVYGHYSHIFILDPNTLEVRMPKVCIEVGVYVPESKAPLRKSCNFVWCS